MTHTENSRIFLTVLWTFVVLNFFARDIHELGRPGILKQMMSGTFDGVEITEALMLLGGVMIEIPTLMTVLALLFPRQANRWTNAAASFLTMAMIIAGNLNPDLDNVFFMGIQLITLVAIVRIACLWAGDRTAAE